MVYAHYKILLNKEKEYITNTRDESQKQFKYNKTQKGLIIWFHSIRFQGKNPNYRVDIEADQILLREGGRDLLHRGMRELSGVMEIFCLSCCVVTLDKTQMCAIVHK